ncbi:MAG: hypothetical protein JMN26_18430, partial [gamma proteobacterium endosymbiont of Lamellibrachia anaximandri]|nr:hypothetical protein [gamma proteobacterium endosymbiont of Lamellibrachia anaximandri]
RSDAYFASPLAQGTPGKQCGLAATGDYQPSLRSPWLAAKEVDPEETALFIVATLEGCMSMAKNAQDKAVLLQCGKGVLNYLDSLGT